MASKDSSSASAKPSQSQQIAVVGEENYTPADVMEIIDSLKKQVFYDRRAYIKKKMEENKQSLINMTQLVYNLSFRNCSDHNNDLHADLLTRRQDDALCTLNSLEQSGEKDSGSCQEESSYASTAVLIGNNFGGKNVQLIKLPEVPKLPLYTTWIFLDRNQIMTEDQSVVGRRRIYYDHNGGEALICSDSEDDIVEEEEEKKEFGTIEDFIIRCLIARNLLCGLKTCMEVFQYMNNIQDDGTYRTTDGVISLIEGHGKVIELRTRSRFLRRRGRVRRLKYTWKSAGYHSIRKRITERKDQPCRQYNPCGCQSACGKQCRCLLSGTCCEKYCGCPKICKNRFRGCHCAKSQCRSRQCPCFAADRECDPDVCRNCWVGCGDGTLGGPNQRGDNYECRNMKLLLKQRQRVLLGRSDVSGWGAFLKNSVGKHEYLGEYTGELISHREADKRGKIYDRENSSFLFNLNDQYVLDAYRKGDKLKFANHSPDPNCYAKVIMVAGDHRVGIFAKERIGAGEELFYDYRYEPDRAPAWARKPESSASKRDDSQPSSGRAKKLA
ncbi:histone-lysine N-methyltransferase EZ1-like [Zingiber officinale]|uniref:histone-lysine N-methyltransferase EZ1-like n=1 Tax=Zingiber officinale TaxID=94328 RepID=UPI001C4BD870|nr:histone-lysine N-methyltransferase EZ1-like [Zingiber officinale]